MNEAAIIQLKTIVEWAVRPLRAPVLRKRKMREELLSHLIAVFDEEFQRSNDEQEALAETEKRFGEPANVRQELDATVPLADRFSFQLEKLGPKPGESIWHFLRKIALANFAFWIWNLILMICGRLARGRTADVGFVLRLSIVMALALFLLTFLFVFVANRLARAIYGRPEERSRRNAILYGLVYLAILPALTPIIYVGLGIDAALLYVRQSNYVAPLMPVLLVLLARQYAEQTRYDEEWATLAID